MESLDIYTSYINIHVLYMRLFCVGIPKVDVDFKLVENIFNMKGDSKGCLSRCCSTGELDMDSESSGAACTLRVFGGVYVSLALLWSGHLSVSFQISGIQLCAT